MTASTASAEEAAVDTGWARRMTADIASAEEVVAAVRRTVGGR